MYHVGCRPVSTTCWRWKKTESTVQQLQAADDANSRPVDFSLSPAANKNLPFVDTHETVKMLIAQGGFTQNEAEAITRVVVQVIALIYEQNAKNLVSKTYSEITTQQLMQHIASLKKDMVILEKAEFSALRSENEKQQIEIKQLRESVRDEMAKVSSNLKLDLNIEKSRSREDVSLLYYCFYSSANHFMSIDAVISFLFLWKVKKCRFLSIHHLMFD